MIWVALTTLAYLLSLTYSAPVGSCTVNNYTFNNGANYSVPGFNDCLLYKCVDGVAVLEKEGCYANSACRDVNSQWVVNCRTWSCYKTTDDNGSTYGTSLVSSLCSDVKGQCHAQGDTFSLSIKDTNYNKCNCTIDAAHTISYSCFG
ncbi:hypothetical protein Bpfe_021093 [Biomphalaria pfeifferi]|uniref:SUEL-type lectin domain-containing protein n=1 Tax=Biomphalaria pfeifferi TaxID=112525 RepID=A0AAD8B7M1_BIOPF|nr:hypothetical protein Bpfe_021093 [Biomphalaria pfeifferi]